MGQLAAQLNEISIHALLAESDRPPGNSCGTIYLHFYPRSPCGERRMMKLFSQLSTDISIHALLAESDRCCPCAIIAPAISIHALLAESDLLPFAMTITALDFYPRSPCGERHTRGQGAPLGVPYFYPRSPCGERRFHFNAGQHICVISIHALLAESDHRSCTFAAPLLRFLSTLSLRRATPVCQWRRSLKIFLSTLSLRRATHCPYRFAGL